MPLWPGGAAIIITIVRIAWAIIIPAVVAVIAIVVNSHHISVGSIVTAGNFG